MSEEVANQQAEEEKPVVTEGEETPEVKTEETPEAKKEEDPKPEKKDGFQKAIDRQTRKYYEQKARADALEIQLRQTNPGNQKPVFNNAEPDQTKFTTDADYQRALIRFEANKIAQETIAQQRQQEQQAVTKSKWDKDASAMRKEASDFDEEIQDYLASSLVTPAVDKAVLESDRPAAVTHYLATHQDEAEKIAQMSDFRAAIEIGKIEIKIATKPVKQSGAPKPITPIGSKGQTGEIDPEKESPLEFAARRNKELAARGRR